MTPFLKSMSCIACLSVTCLFGCGDAPPKNADDHKITIAMLPKLTNIAYFEACHQGAEAAALELDVEFIYDGPTEPSGSEQVKFMETWIRQGVDAICVAPNQPKAILKSIERAKARGIKVLTWDTDAVDSGRLVMVNQVDDEKLAHLLIDDIARQMNEEGEWAIAIASLDAANLNNWRRIAEARAKAKYPKLKLVDTVVTEEDENVARSKIETMLNVHPDLKGIIAFDSNSVPGAAEAIKQKGLAGKIALTGNSTPGKMAAYLKDGVLESFYLWDPRELGDLTIRLAVRAVKGEPIKPGVSVGKHGKLTFSTKNDSTVILSDPIRFTKENIDEYDWGF